MESYKETDSHNGIDFEIISDDFKESPRNWDNLGIMVIKTMMYCFGDTNQMDNTVLRNSVHLPIYLYNHSGISINTTGFSCKLDSGLVGIIYATPEKIKKEFGVKRISKKIKDRVEACLKREVETMDQYLTDDVWGYNIPEFDDSCWGFYGKEYCYKEAKGMIDVHLDTRKQEKMIKVKTLIRNRVPLDKREKLLLPS